MSDQPESASEWTVDGIEIVTPNRYRFVIWADKKDKTTDAEHLLAEINAALAAERTRNENDRIIAQGMGEQLAAEREKVQTLVDVMKFIRDNANAGVIQAMATDALTKVKEKHG